LEKRAKLVKDRWMQETNLWEHFGCCCPHKET